MPICQNVTPHARTAAGPFPRLHSHGPWNLEFPISGNITKELTSQAKHFKSPYQIPPPKEAWDRPAPHLATAPPRGIIAVDPLRLLPAARAELGPFSLQGPQTISPPTACTITPQGSPQPEAISWQKPAKSLLPPGESGRQRDEVSSTATLLVDGPVAQASL